MDASLLGTTRSQRFKNIFKGSRPSLMDVTRKLYDLIESSILLSKKGGKRISSLGSETGADIKTLAVTVLDMVEQSPNIPAVGRHLFSSDEDDHWVEQSLAEANTFGCKIPDLVEKHLENIHSALAELKNTLTPPKHGFTFRVSHPKKKKPRHIH